MVIIFGIWLGVTVILLDFPIWEQSRLTMETAQVLLVTGAILFVTPWHIYVGKVGAEGVFEGMGTGYVNVALTNQQKNLWDEEIRDNRGEKQDVLS